LVHWPVSLTKKLEYTGCLDNVQRVSGVIKSNALGVQMILTSAPFLMNKRVKTTALYAAIPPVMPRRIFLFGIFFCRISEINLLV